MKLKNNCATNSCIRNIETPVGNFRLTMSCGVYNKEHIFNPIIEALKNFKFEIAPFNANSELINAVADKNAANLQAALYEAAKCGTDLPQARIDVLYSSRLVSIS